MTLEKRIAAVAIGAALIVLTAACAVFVAQFRSEEAGGLRARASGYAAVAAANVAAGAGPEAEMEALAASGVVTEAEIYDAQGRIIADFSRRPAAAVSTHTLVEARTPIQKDGRRSGEVMVRLASTSSGVGVGAGLALAGGLFLAAVIAVMIIARVLAKRMVSPVRRLEAAMAAVRESRDFSRLAPGAGSDEFGRLTAAFNDLLLRLQANDRELRHAMTELTQARDAAEAANVQKSQFLANMSHEIRTPLNGVLAMAQVMAQSDLSAEQAKRLDVVRQSGEALLAVLNDVLDVSKIEAGKLILEPLDVDVGELLREVVESFHVLAEAKHLTLTCEIDDDAEGVRRADPQRLRQVVANLLSNAVKFTERGGVRLRVRGDGVAGAEGLSLAISDTGIGVEAHRVASLFEKFTQGDSSTTRRFGGTGLGLAICRDLVQMMGGAIWVESERARGSTFHVNLPLARTAAAAPSASTPPPSWADAPAPASSPRELRVLAAEDNAANRMVLSTIMDVFGIAIELVEDGRQAVEAWRLGDYDLILMDVQMPQMDGVAATRAIRSLENQTGRRRTPIIALSANAMTHQVREYLLAGMDAHVSKPIELNRLQSAIGDALAAGAVTEPESTLRIA